MNRGGNDVSSGLNKAKFQSKIYGQSLYQEFMNHPQAKYAMRFIDYKKKSLREKLLKEYNGK